MLVKYRLGYFLGAYNRHFVKVLMRCVIHNGAIRFSKNWCAVGYFIRIGTFYSLWAKELLRKYVVILDLSNQLR